MAEQTITGNSEVAAEIKKEPKVKTRKPKQGACDEKNEKGKLCAGHLKRWFEFRMMF